MSQTDLAHQFGESFNTVNLYAANKVQQAIVILYKTAKS